MVRLGCVLLVGLYVAGCESSGPAAVAETAGRDRASGQVQKAGFEGIPDRIFIRAFKDEEVLEIWGSLDDNEPMGLVVTYPIAQMSGRLGPKRREGDGQVPEGLYHVTHFNPQSRFHLSLGLNYPNASDKVRSDPVSPGSDIFIHGNQVSIGCMAMTDPVIEEIWAIATHARDKDQKNIPVHIFPFRMSEARIEELGKTPELKAFWRELLPFYESFERSKLVPRFTVNGLGEYDQMD